MRTEWQRRIVVSAKIVSGLFLMGGTMAFAQQAPAAQNAQITAAEAWAFPVFPPPDPHATKPDPDKVVRVPGSSRSYQAPRTNLFNPPDWFPQDHPSMPQIVAQGRKPVWACGFCHMPNGAGDAASAALAGLPKAYLLQQVAAFRDGARGKGTPPTTNDMAEEVQNLSDADLQLAADYFSGMRLVSPVKVVETSTVPKTHWEDLVLTPDRGNVREPIGERIIEIPSNFELYKLGDEHVHDIAYVPPGSVERGASIAAKGVDAAPACESCHGAKLEGESMPGIGVVPPLAGRSPTYIARELILFREGKRTNPQATPMVQEVAKLTLKDMVDVAAYAASQKP